MAFGLECPLVIEYPDPHHAPGWQGIHHVKIAAIAAQCARTPHQMHSCLQFDSLGRGKKRDNEVSLAAVKSYSGALLRETSVGIGIALFAEMSPIYFNQIVMRHGLLNSAFSVSFNSSLPCPRSLRSLSMNAGETQGYILTFRCVNCGKHEVFC